MTRIEKKLAAYDYILKLLQMNNDNYFKRTQTLMIVAQSAAFIAFTKLLSSKGSIENLCCGVWLLKDHPGTIYRIVLLAIASLGILAAWLWHTCSLRQYNVLEFQKTYLRGIESSLMKLNVPLGYFTYEQVIFYYRSCDDKQLYVHFPRESEGFPFKVTDKDPCAGDTPEYRECLREPEWFPHTYSKKQLKLGLSRYERRIPWVLAVVWAAIWIINLIALFDC